MPVKDGPERAAAVVIFLRIASKWSLSDRDAGTLLGVTAATIIRWRQTAPRTCAVDCDARAWLLLEVAARGQQYFGRSSAWLAEPRKDLAGNSLLQAMLAGSEADLVRAVSWLQRFPETLRSAGTTKTPRRKA